MKRYFSYPQIVRHTLASHSFAEHTPEEIENEVGEFAKINNITLLDSTGLSIANRDYVDGRLRGDNKEHTETWKSGVIAAVNNGANIQLLDTDYQRIIQNAPTPYLVDFAKFFKEKKKVFKTPQKRLDVLKKDISEMINGDYPGTKEDYIQLVANTLYAIQSNKSAGLITRKLLAHRIFQYIIQAEELTKASYISLQKLADETTNAMTIGTNIVSLDMFDEITDIANETTVRHPNSNLACTYEHFLDQLSKFGKKPTFFTHNALFAKRSRYAEDFQQGRTTAAFEEAFIDAVERGALLIANKETIARYLKNVRQNLEGCENKETSRFIRDSNNRKLQILKHLLNKKGITPADLLSVDPDNEYNTLLQDVLDEATQHEINLITNQGTLREGIEEIITSEECEFPAENLKIYSFIDGVFRRKL